jgi:hypothetical protein
LIVSMMTEPAMFNRMFALLFATRLLVARASAQTLRFGLLEDPDALDPTFARTFASGMVFAALCDKLVDIGEPTQVRYLAVWAPETPGALACRDQFHMYECLQQPSATIVSIASLA